MALGRSQAEMRVQTLSKALGANAEIPPGRGPEGIKTSFSPRQILTIFILLPVVASQNFMVMAENILQ